MTLSEFEQKHVFMSDKNAAMADIEIMIHEAYKAGFIEGGKYLQACEVHGYSIPETSIDYLKSIQ